MPFLSEQFLFLALSSLWHLPRAQLSSGRILRTSQEMNVRRKCPSWQRGLTPAEEPRESFSGCRSDGEAVSSESILGPHSSALWGTAGVPGSAGPRGHSWGALDSFRCLHHRHRRPWKLTPAADDHKGARASCMGKIHNLGMSSWLLILGHPQKSSVKHYEKGNEIFLPLKMSYQLCFKNQYT